jgi:hypothetical protein
MDQSDSCLQARARRVPFADPPFVIQGRARRGTGIHFPCGVMDSLPSGGFAASGRRWRCRALPSDRARDEGVPMAQSAASASSPCGGAHPAATEGLFFSRQSRSGRMEARREASAPKGAIDPLMDPLSGPNGEATRSLSCVQQGRNPVIRRPLVGWRGWPFKQARLSPATPFTDPLLYPGAKRGKKPPSLLRRSSAAARRWVRRAPHGPGAARGCVSFRLSRR